MNVDPRLRPDDAFPPADPLDPIASQGEVRGPYSPTGTSRSGILVIGVVVVVALVAVALFAGHSTTPVPPNTQTTTEQTPPAPPPPVQPSPPVTQPSG
jgi:hypothetical protein